MIAVSNVILFLVGVVLIGATLISAVRTLILPRGARDFVLQFAFRCMGLLFSVPLKFARTFDDRDRVMALYAPLTLMLLPIIWLVIASLGYTLMYWSIGVRPWAEAFLLSGSSLFTLGFADANTTPLRLLVFSEAALGLALVALLIAYLPSMYNAFSRREGAVSLLEVRAGSPPSAVEWILRANRNEWLPKMGEQFALWENWFADLEESHTSLSALVYFRSPKPDRSWITASGAVLDTAAMMVSVVESEFDAMTAQLCLRAGYLALMQIADVLNISYSHTPRFPDDPISIGREEFMFACDKLSSAGVPLREDREQSWLDFAGWRVNYDRPLIALATLIKAPYAPWSSDRCEF